MQMTIAPEIPMTSNFTPSNANGELFSSVGLAAQTNPYVSVVVPCFNEENNVCVLIAGLHQVLSECDFDYELIFVDDASTDATAKRLRDAAKTDTGLRVINHKQNYGQSAAFLTGFDNARGEILVTLDGDLQNDPADIPAMLELLKSADAVCGVRQKRRDSRMKRVASRIANGVRQLVLQDGIRDAGCCFRVIRREAITQLPAFRALHRFLPTILKIHGYRVLQLRVRHHPRYSGISKYGVGNRAFVGILDLIGIWWYKSRNIPPNRIRIPAAHHFFPD